ncbi:DUF6265 family protein [Pedobacter punctiformis]|uniref:DUF6265 family protein n=1 Tax=Pedobacter punctiformis TaxID=3004097 RepID=A0ABT4L5G4_9SPHI|nr:DUF6265 family protein [Pedobacter sp. HCMS5-2]MCZ4243157.1 DUF6265 family protein [Pedobacter sp. HCMS5-2]
MKKKTLNLFLLLIFYVTLGAKAQNRLPKAFNFLLGSWEMQTSKGKIIEHWKINTDQNLKGESYRINIKGDSLLTETLTIKKIGKEVFYCSTVTGQNDGKEVCFKLISTKQNTYIFENLTHDFPQRIVYQNQGKDHLLAWIEGAINGQNKKSEFKYKRI